MKKTKLINSDISFLISKLGHGDTIVIADSGLPIPEGVQRIDLALTKGVPSFIETLTAVLEEQCVEEVILASELKDKNAKVYKQIAEELLQYEKTEELQLNVTEISHEAFKLATQKAKAIIRTGEYSPYANIILKSGVVF